MMKDLLFHQQQQQVGLEENMSNLTSASGEASVSSGQYFAPPLPQPQLPLAKKKRNLPGNPDPDAEVIALSPKTLLATNRFLCEICNKGFQRDQNLQLHRRSHNLPWKLKQRTNKEVTKKVYVCPEPSCVHHDPSRALGDLTGIKKHFCRKHGEKKWKCEKCSKRYAVQSDWKAHSKTCGTKEYRCDCGTLFSRRDSFTTHRAFCDALAEESARAIPLLSTHQLGSSSSTQFNPQAFPVLKKEQQTNFNLLRAPEIPPWLAPKPILGPGPGPPPLDHLSSSSSASIFSTSRLDHHHQDQFNHHHDLSNPNPNLADPTLLSFHPSTVPSQAHLSATALLQKAAQMGATVSNNTVSATALRPHHQAHVSAGSNSSTTTPAGFGLNFISREIGGAAFIHGLNAGGATSAAGGSHSPLQEMVKSLSSGTGLNGTSIDDDIGGVFANPNKLEGSYGTETLSKATSTNGGRNNETGGGRSGGGGGEDLTRDFLGIRAFSHSDMLNIAALGNWMNTSHEHNQKPWQGDFPAIFRQNSGEIPTYSWLIYILLRESIVIIKMSRNPGSSSARRRASFSGRETMFADDLPVEFAQGVDLGVDESGHDPLLEDADPVTADPAAEGPSSSKGKKGRGRNLKGLRPPASKEERKWIKLTPDKLQFADPTIPRAITSLWKSRFDGPYFTYERVPHSKVMEIYNMFKALYQWHPADDRHVRQAFLTSMKHRWSDNIRVERLRWEEDPHYIPCWIPGHVWSQMQDYWKSEEFQMLSERGAKNRNSGERVTHTTGSVSFGIHEMRMAESRGGVQPPHQEKYKETHTFRKKVAKGQEGTWINEKAKYRHDTYVESCRESHGPDVNLWPQMDHQAWGTAVGGCSSNFMPGIGSQVNPEDVGFTYRRRQPRDNLMTAMMISDFNEEQARQQEQIEQQRQQIAQMQQQLAQMTAYMYGNRPQEGHYPFPHAQPSFSHASGLRPHAAFTRSSDSSQTSPLMPDYQQQQQLPQQDDVYHPVFDPAYQPH